MRTSIDSMSSILRSDVLLEASDLFRGLCTPSSPPTVRVLEFMGLPSTTIKGSCPPLMVPVPLIRKYALVPASPLVFLISRPGTLPRRAVTMFVSPDFLAASGRMDSIKTPSFFRSISPPSPVTTTVSRPRTSGDKIRSFLISLSLEMVIVSRFDL